MKTITFAMLISFGFFAGMAGCGRTPTAQQVLDSKEAAAEDRAREEAYEKGRQRAEKDIRKGVLAIRSYGLPVGPGREYADLLASRYGIQSGTRGCCVTSGEIEEAQGYNEIMRAEIATRFGKDALAKTQADAILQHLENPKR
jgi:hypothetical protein